MFHYYLLYSKSIASYRTIAKTTLPIKYKDNKKVEKRQRTSIYFYSHKSMLQESIVANNNFNHIVRD